MYFTKKIIQKLRRCYAVAPLHYNQEDCFLVASEESAPCYLFDSKGVIKDTIWTSPGGTMSLVQLPGSNGQFLATQGFYSPNNAANAKIVYVSPTDSGWDIRMLCRLPYVHRFDVLHADGKYYLLAATLKSGMDYSDDWSYPGELWAAPLPSANALKHGACLELQPIMTGIMKNHGFYKMGTANRQYALIGSESGIFKVTPPDTQKDTWQIDLLIERPASDMTFVDFDNDGVDEIVVFSPFHGSVLEVYKQIAGSYSCVFHEEGLDFLHAIWGGKLHGVPMAIIGHRGGEQALFSLTFDGEYRLTKIDSGVGAANVAVMPVDGINCIVAANRETDEIAVYTPCN